jgi:hypothetical protein
VILALRRHYLMDLRRFTACIPEVQALTPALYGLCFTSNAWVLNQCTIHGLCFERGCVPRCPSNQPEDNTYPTQGASKCSDRNLNVQVKECRSGGEACLKCQGSQCKAEVPKQQLQSKEASRQICKLQTPCVSTLLLFILPPGLLPHAIRPASGQQPAYLSAAQAFILTICKSAIHRPEFQPLAVND